MRYFSVNGEGGFTLHATADAARDAAEANLEHETDGDTDEDAVDRICWGVVMGRPVLTSRISREEAFAADPESGAGYLMQRYGWDFLVTYEMRDTDGAENAQPDPEVKDA